MFTFAPQQRSFQYSKMVLFLSEHGKAGDNIPFVLSVSSKLQLTNPNNVSISQVYGFMSPSFHFIISTFKISDAPKWSIL